MIERYRRVVLAWNILFVAARLVGDIDRLGFFVELRLSLGTDRNVGYPGVVRDDRSQVGGRCGEIQDRRAGQVIDRRSRRDAGSGQITAAVVGRAHGPGHDGQAARLDRPIAHYVAEARHSSVADAERLTGHGGGGGLREHQDRGAAKWSSHSRLLQNGPRDDYGYRAISHSSREPGVHTVTPIRSV